MCNKLKNHEDILRRCCQLLSKNEAMEVLAALQEYIIKGKRTTFSDRLMQLAFDVEADNLL